MSHLPLDARAILHYLNELGYRNISATQLKEFLKDLRKLIKYEECMGVNTQQNDYYESLFRRTTASYRAKIDQENEKSDPVKSNFPIENQKVLSERNFVEKSTSSDLQDNVPFSMSKAEKKIKGKKTDARSLKALIERILEQVLHDKYSQEFVDKDCNIKYKENSPIRSVVEQVLKEKLSDVSHRSKKKLNSSPESLRSVVENIVTQVLDEKLTSLQKEGSKTKDSDDGINNLYQDLQQKLRVSNEGTIALPREPVIHYKTNEPLNSQYLVQQLLANDGKNNENGPKHTKKSKADKRYSVISSTAGCIKRLNRSPRKKPEWQDPSLHDKMLNKPPKAVRSQSPVASSSVRSGRSKCSSSVLIRRSKSQGRKPKSDPVALYQYYKNEWEHFRQQIPGETGHSVLRWHVRQRLLDPE